MSERTWKDWTRTDWYNAAYCEHCGLPLLEIADNEAGTRGHYECIYCTWMDDHDVETNSLRAQVAALQAALQSAKSEVDEILRAALSGDCDRYLNYDLQGNKYCKWGVVSMDIAAVFDVTEPSDIDVSEQGFND